MSVIDDIEKIAGAIASWAQILSKDAEGPISNFLDGALLGAAAGSGKSTGDMLNHLRALFGKLAVEFSDVIETDLGGLGNLRPGEGKDAFATVMGDAFLYGIGAHLTAITCEVFDPLKHLGVPTIAALMAEFSGFKELVSAYHGPIVHHAIRVPSMAEHAAKFRSTPPAGHIAAQWRARRIIGDGAADDPIAWSGLMPDYADAEKAAAYSAVQPRMLATLYQDVPFPRAQVQSMLEFHGVRPQDLPTLLDGLERASMKNVRQAFMQSAVKAAERGNMTEAELDSDLDLLNFSDEAKGFVHLTVANTRLEQLAELYRKSVDEAYNYGLIDDSQYVPNLEAIGIAEADAEAHHAIVSFKKQGKALLAEERAAAMAARAQVRAAVTAATADYAAGNVDEGGLAAALAIAGMAAIIIPYVVAYQRTRRLARRRNIAGALVDEGRAVGLREQIALMHEQVSKKLVTPAAAYDYLVNAGIPAANAQLLVSEAAAVAKIVWP
jgi:hypothetical protein